MCVLAIASHHTTSDGFLPASDRCFMWAAALQIWLFPPSFLHVAVGGKANLPCRRKRIGLLFSKPLLPCCPFKMISWCPVQMRYLVAFSGYIERFIVSFGSKGNSICAQLVNDTSILYYSLRSDHHHIHSAIKTIFHFFLRMQKEEGKLEIERAFTPPLRWYSWCLVAQDVFSAVLCKLVCLG